MRPFVEMGTRKRQKNIRHVEQEVFMHISIITFLNPEFRVKG
jgi:hypothetical protein